MAELSSEETLLIERAKKGEREAFDELYQRYKRVILNYVYRYIGNFANAEELTQEVFVRAYLNIHRFEPRAKFSSWLFKIASNLCKNFLRDFRYERAVLSANRELEEGAEDAKEAIENIEDNKRGPDESAHLKETERLIREAMKLLHPKLKEALILCDMEGFSYEEAARIMRCNPMTVGSRLFRAREKMAKLLGYLKNGE
jgi:RNA polymerase sigma-70 factor (ECF subfamily)